MPRPGAPHTLQLGRPWHMGAFLFPSGRLAGAHKQSVPRTKGKVVLALGNSWTVPVKALYSHCSTTLRCFLTARRRNWENINKKLKLDDVLNAPLRREKRNCSSSCAVRHPPKFQWNTPQVHSNLAGDGIGGFVTQALVKSNHYKDLYWGLPLTRLKSEVPA
jgi:hypothetical protein